MTKGALHKKDLEGELTFEGELSARVIRAAEAVASAATQVLNIYGDVFVTAQVAKLQEIRKAPAAIAEIPPEEGLSKVLEYLAEIESLLSSALEQQRKQERRTRLYAYVGWGLAVGAIIVSIIISIIK